MLTFSHSMLYNSLTAALICRLFDLISTMKTNVLLSSINFMEDSVVKGYLMIACLSRVLFFGTLVRAYLGLRSCFNVLGLKKCTLVWMRVPFFETPFFRAFFTASALPAQQQRGHHCKSRCQPSHSFLQIPTTAAIYSFHCAYLPSFTISLKVEYTTMYNIASQRKRNPEAE